MIEIFGLKNETQFFIDLIKLKMTEEKYRDVVLIQKIFPEILVHLESFQDFHKLEKNSNKDIRFFLIQKLI